GVVGLRLTEISALLPVESGIGGVSCLGKRRYELTAQIPIVFHNKYAHAAKLRKDLAGRNPDDPDLTGRLQNRDLTIMVVSRAAKRESKNFCILERAAKLVFNLLVGLIAPFTPRMGAGLFRERRTAAKGNVADQQGRPDVFHGSVCIGVLDKRSPLN